MSPLLDPLAWLILLPLLWATLAFVAAERHGPALALAGTGGQLLCVIVLASDVAGHGSIGHLAGGWAEPLGIRLVADGLSLVMLLLTQGVALALALYARSYFSRATPPAFWPLTGFLLAGMNALFLSGDLFNLYVTLELVGLAAVGLVAAGGGAAQIAAALRYLLATLVGSGAYLFGVALIYGSYGTVSASLLGTLITAEAPLAVWLAGGLMLTGLLLKTALLPFHFWLPPAHGGAPAPVSALLSALVVKASFYLFLRLWLGPFAALTEALPALAQVPAALGATAILWGSWRAIRADRLKMLVAYSTVAQLGYLFLIFPLLGTGALALQAGILQATAHGLAKAAMFVAAGTLIKVGGSDRVLGVAGAAAHLPVTLFAFALAGVTLMGLPPSGGFLAKWLLIDAALVAGQPWIVVVALSGGLLAGIYVFRVLRLAFRRPTAHEDVPLPQRPAALLEWTAFALAAGSVLIGLGAAPLLALIAGVQP
ncbi:MAG: hydrogenase 4 subunit B [Dechloromonas sp.]|jgi:formate hydrogenlyase subunit 3/multisubunit Na+/H+ antiporter MnhD subunit|nr:hydrogenase 4 subunit B [Dechloromonas sp.]